jgi:tocopherol O-methyltransferase
MVAAQDIEAYYDQSHPHYVAHWKLRQYQAMHYGLWWPETRHLGEALLNTQRFLAEQGQLQATDRVLDAGCGVGGSSVWLAENLGCTVLGITLSQRQVARARQWAEAQGQVAQVQFERRDFCATALPAEGFDVVWAIESACHANDKRAFLQEAHRLLRPGGRLLVCDFMRHRPLAQTTPAYAQWLDGWAIPGLWAAEQWQKAAQSVGFAMGRYQDLTDAIRPSARRLHQRFWLGFPVHKLYEWLAHPTEVQRKSARSARWQWQALQAGDWGYGLFAATKASG